MHLTPREQERLLIYLAAEVAIKRRARGLTAQPGSVTVCIAQIPFIALQDAHAAESWWWSDMLAGFRTLFLAKEPTWQGWLDHRCQKAQQDDEYAHIAAFYNSVVTGAEPPADITIGATAALTAILGHQAMSRQQVVEWSGLGVEL